jgi:hypothetical protein
VDEDDIEADGSMFGNSVPDQWLAGMNSFGGTGYLGFNGWRFTTSNCQDAPGYDCRDSEFSHLFYNELGGSANSPISDSSDPDLSLFSNIVENNWYWTGSTHTSTTKLLVFNFYAGANSRVFGTLSQNHVWAVHDGDIGAVPIPAAIWLFGTALIGLVGFSRQSKSI